MFSASHIIELIYLCTTDVLIILGNLLVILAFISGPKSIYTHTNYFVTNLAFCDLLVGFIPLPIWIGYRLGIINEDYPHMEYLMSVDILFGIISIISLTAISLERMFAVKFPAKHRNLKERNVYLIMFGIWMLGTLLTFIKFAIPKVTKFGERDKVYMIIILPLGFLLPLFGVVVSYAIIFYSVHTMMIPSNQTRNISREIHVTITISVIVSMFIICWLPFFVVNFLFYFNGGGTDYTVLIYVAKAFHFSNSMTNFFVYSVRSEDFRDTFKSIFRHCCNFAVVRNRLRTLSNEQGRLFFDKVKNELDIEDNEVEIDLRNSNKLVNHQIDHDGNLDNESLLNRGTIDNEIKLLSNNDHF